MGKVKRQGAGERQVAHPSGQLHDDPAPRPTDGRQPSPGVPARRRAPQRHLAFGQLDGGGGAQLAALVQRAGESPPVVERGRRRPALDGGGEHRGPVRPERGDEQRPLRRHGARALADQRAAGDGEAVDESAAEVHVGGRAYGVRFVDPKRLRGARGAAGHDGGRAEIKSPMPGKLVRVLVERGQQVEAGTPLVVVEAMKMQNEMKSPRAGTVTELRVAPGATVNAGDVLAVIE
jgi:biotin carboxyl carrier protein